MLSRTQFMFYKQHSLDIHAGFGRSGDIAARGPGVSDRARSGQLTGLTCATLESSRLDLDRPGGRIRSQEGQDVRFPDRLTEVKAVKQVGERGGGGPRCDGSLLV